MAIELIFLLLFTIAFFYYFDIFLWTVYFTRKQAPGTFADGQALCQNKEKQETLCVKTIAMIQLTFILTISVFWETYSEYIRTSLMECFWKIIVSWLLFSQ